MFRALAVSHVAIAILLMPLTLFPLTLTPIMVGGPIWTIMLALRLWRRDATVLPTLRRTHYVFLIIDALLIVYGFWMLRAADESAARGGGLLGGFGLIPLGVGVFLAVFSALTLLLTSRMQRAV